MKTKQQSVYSLLITESLQAAYTIFDNQWMIKMSKIIVQSDRSQHV